MRCDDGYLSKPLARWCGEEGNDTHTLSPLPVTVSAIVVCVCCVGYGLWWCFAPLLFSASSCSSPPLPLFFSDFMRDTKIKIARPGTQTKKEAERLHRLY